MMCPKGGLGVVDDGSLPAARAFPAHCDCGAYITVLDGQVPFHEVGENQLPTMVPSTPSGNL